MKTKEEKLEDLRWAIEELHGQIAIGQYQRIWAIIEEIELDLAIEQEEAKL